MSMGGEATFEATRLRRLEKTITMLLGGGTLG